MVQRKTPEKLGIQATLIISHEDHHQKRSKGSEVKRKMMKKSRSFKLSETSQQSSKSPSSAPKYTMKKSTSFKLSDTSQQSFKSPSASPNYMKSTSCFEARNKELRASPSYGDSGVKNSSPAAMKKRSAIETSTARRDVERATCSSTLKDSKFPNYLMLNDKGVSAVKVCPYSYCSLNGHIHHKHASLPPLKQFVSEKRRALKKIRKKCEETEAKVGFFVEIFAYESDQGIDGFGVCGSNDQSETSMEWEDGNFSENSVEKTENNVKLGGDFFVEIYADDSEGNNSCGGCGSNDQTEASMEWEDGNFSVNLVEKTVEKVEPCVGLFYEIYDDDSDEGKSGFGGYKRDDEMFSGQAEVFTELIDGNFSENIVEETIEKFEPGVGLFVDICADESNKRNISFGGCEESDDQRFSGSSEVSTEFKAENFSVNLIEKTDEKVELSVGLCDINYDDDSDEGKNDFGGFEESDDQRFSGQSDASKNLIDVKNLDSDTEEMNTDSDSLSGYSSKIGNSSADTIQELCYDENIREDSSEVGGEVVEEHFKGKEFAMSSKEVIDEDYQRDIVCGKNGLMLKSQDESEYISSSDQTQILEICDGSDEKINVSESGQDDINKKRSLLFNEQENSDQELRSKWNRTKREVNPSEEDTTRDFNPREPKFLPLTADPEGERVDLKHQTVDERKNSEDWMIDRALQQTVNKLGAARKRRVALLVEAFETVTPVIKRESSVRMNHHYHNHIHQYENHPSSPVFQHAIIMPIQACN